MKRRVCFLHPSPIYLEEGPGNPATKAVESGLYDAFDSAKKQRVYDANGGQVKYHAELTDSERKAIYEAILQNNLLAVRNEFTLVNSIVSPKHGWKIAPEHRWNLQGNQL